MFRGRSLSWGKHIPKDSGRRYNSILLRRIKAPPEVVFNVVADVSRYHEFVPFVQKSFINKVDTITQLPTEAGIQVGWRHITEEFVCNIECEKNVSVSAIALSTDLFERLYNKWEFKKVVNRMTGQSETQVDFYLLHRFQNPIYNSTLSIFQSQITHAMIHSFEKRALIQSKLGKNNA